MKPWRDKERLKEAYEELGSFVKVGEEFECSKTTIEKWLNKFDIETNNPPGETHKQKPWRDKQKLKEAYEELDSFVKVGDRFGCSQTTIEYWLNKFDIETNPPPSERFGKNAPAYHRYDKHTLSQNTLWERGYEVWNVRQDGKYYTIPVHRLVAVAEFGLEAIENMHIHHKNECPFDNRPENLVPMTPSEHSKHHNSKREITESQSKLASFA